MKEQESEKARCARKVFVSVGALPTPEKITVIGQRALIRGDE